jgi:16S rRNA G966 N2-methylase RsmD
MPETIYRKLKDLTKLKGNPRTIRDNQFVALCESVKNNADYFFARPLILSDRTGDLTIIAGNQRFEAAKYLKFKEVPTCLLSDLTEEREREIIIRDNVNNGSWDEDVLANEWNLDELQEWGLELPNFDGIEPESIAEDEAAVGEMIDKAEELNKKWKVKTDDLWQIGRHRLLCGDSTKKENVEKLMGGEKAELFITDPPYNINFYAQRNKKGYDTSQDDLIVDDYFNLLISVYINAQTVTEKAIITCGKQNLTLWLSGFNVSEIGIWIAKNKMSGGKVSHLSLWEPVLFIGDFDRASRPTDLFEFNTSFQKDADAHPCPKQPDFFADLIASYSTGATLDLFAGSGTTFIASEKLNRKGFGLELSENYCAVILERLTTLGLEAKRIT